MPILPDEIQSVVENAERTDNHDELHVLGKKQDQYEGDFVLQHQQTGREFGHVSQMWLDKCITYEQGMEVLADQQSNIADIKAPLKEWQPVITDEGRFAMRRLTTGRDYFPTEHALTNMSVLGKGSSWTLNDLNADKVKTTDEDEVIWHRDRRDAEVMKSLVELLLFQPDRMDQDKVRLFRTWDNDNTLRAVLSKDYTIVNNQWFLETVAKLVPGGMLSHWRGDADSIFGNVLIPDTIRTEDDSDYGGLLSIGNSEIGLRRITSCPSVFRAICMNGCIWNAEIGKGISQVHRKKDGKIDLDGLAKEIKINLEKQIPLIEEGIRQVLAIRDFGFAGVNPLNVVAAVVQKLRISKKHAKGIVNMLRVEQGVLANDTIANSAFAVMNAMTRFSQTLGPIAWVSMDASAGKITQMNRKQWDALIKVAASLNDKEIAKATGVEVAS